MPTFTFSIHGRATVWKYVDEEHYLAGRPFAVVKTMPNEIMYSGASAVWQMMTGTWADLPFGGTSAIGVGDGSGGGRTLTDLTGGNKKRKGMKPGYPEHHPDNDELSTRCKYRSLFLGGEANFTWREWGIFNSVAGGQILNHEVQNNGRKRSGMVWDMLVEVKID